MTGDPFRRLLGVDETADEATLLGLGEPPYDRVRIESALRDRIERLFRHPEGRSAAAERVRTRLREAAALLASGRAAAAPPARPPRSSGPARRAAAPTLTEFDRAVLGIMVACGGWNAQARARLVVLASAYRVTAGGLVKVVRGLSNYARAGGPRVGVADLATEGGRFVPAAEAGASGLPGADPRAVSGALAEVEARLRERMSGQIVVAPPRDTGAWSTLRLCLLFGTVTVVLGTLLLKVAFTGDTPAPAEPAPPPIVLTAPAAPPGVAAGTTRAPADVARPTRYDRLPTFLGNAVPLEAADAADRGRELPEDLDEIIRRLSITDDPSEAVFRHWEVVCDTAAGGWVLADDSTLAAIRRDVVGVLRETIDKPSVGDRLLEALVPPRDGLTAPLEVWRGAWQAGMLGVIADAGKVPPAAAEQARRHLAVALGEGGPGAEGFTGAADAWLRRAVPALVDDTEIDARAYDFWEMWLAAQRRLGGDDRTDTALMTAVAQLLGTSTDLGRPGPSANVLGRLLTVANFESSPVVRDAVAALFDDREGIDDHDLWVLTSLLAQLDTAPWFEADLVLPPEGGDAYRNRIRDRIAARWPTVRGHEGEAEAHARGLEIDAGSAARWLSLSSRFPPRPSGAAADELMARLLLAVRINEAVLALASRQFGPADAVMTGIEQSLAGGPAPGGAGVARRPAAARGQALGRDGEWTAAYAEARRNTEERVRLLRDLRARAGTDLGPLDSELFVREVYRGSPQEVRALARAIAVEQFAQGPSVALEMLDQFVDAPKNEGVSDTISRLTGRLLPPPRSESWPSEARLALLHHAVDLLPAGPSAIDVLATGVRDAYVAQAVALGEEPSGGAAAMTPELALQRLAEAWRGRAAGAIAIAPAPDDLPGLERRERTRRRLARGPLQTLVAGQLSLLDHFTYLTVAERPAARDAALAVLVESARRRARAQHVLDQAVEAERALSRMWMVRLGLEPPPDAEAPP